MRGTIHELATAFYDDVFQFLDGYYLAHEMSAEDAGHIATLTAQALRDAVDKHFNGGDAETESMETTTSADVVSQLSCCPRCGGEIRATVERYYSLRGGMWVESGVDGDSRLYCEKECDLSEYAGRIREIG